VPTACYKLYSAPQMIDRSGTLAFEATDAPADWNSAANAGLYTDLNAPRQLPGFFASALYPILDPAAETACEGVSTDRDVTMPVAWIYEFQDGTLGPMSAGTKANPIVARLAFWTDDETSRININTAGCGSPWATPRANTTDDVAWSTTQPAAGEYARYPGHPASTSLAVAFGPAMGGAWSGLDPLAYSQQLLALTPRYAAGGSNFGTQSTTAGETVPPKIGHLYASVDELCFDATATSASLRPTNPVTPAQLEAARFVLTAHSEAPETTLLGDPRIAIWPVSDAPNDPTRTTATDRAMRSAATLGNRAYLFQRHNALSPTDDLDPTICPSNFALFSELVARGGRILPGQGAAFTTSKYPGATWTQLMLEITDFIRGINAIDPSPAPFNPYAATDPATGCGRGFIIPLTTSYGPSNTTLRGLGRCPTLSSLVLVVYVCGFEFKNPVTKAITSIDYTATPDDITGSSWAANFAPSSPNWTNATNELVRAFVVPVTFHPGCGFPEVSDDCDVEIDGLDKLTITSPGSTGGFAFPATANSAILGSALNIANPERAWGGNEGPLAWRAAASTGTYPFAGSSVMKLPFSVKPRYSAGSGHLTWPNLARISMSELDGVTVKIRDANHNTLQTFKLTLPAFTCSAPSPLQEVDHYDGASPDTAESNWSSDSTRLVTPSYYMNLANRLAATQNSRPFMIQPGDVARSIDASTDLRVIAGLNTVTPDFFASHPSYSDTVALAHNLRFADGTAAYGASGTTPVVGSAAYPDGTTVSPPATVVNWTDKTSTTLTWSASPSRSAPIFGPGGHDAGVTMIPSPGDKASPPSLSGDWDTGPGFAPDGALINLPDAGSTLDSGTAYFSLASGKPTAPTQRTPNALVPSPVAFGSLPAGIDPLNPASSQPWRTLLFSPNPAAGAAHPGFATPPDHLILDNFWMPTIEPYALSGCLVTAGKINLNDAIAPFSYLHRSTGLRALLHDLRIPAIPTSLASAYKTTGAAQATIWQPVDVDSTIAGLESRFTGADAYLSESEICTVPLVPQGVTKSGLDAFWNNSTGGGRLTGDNLRELPYAQLYSRLTTRSNSYLVHVQVQVLQKLPGDPHQDQWNDATDRVLGEWRGSYEIERDLDPAASAPAAAPAPAVPVGPYHFRIVSSRRFSP
jgi:uncharacterized protein (TIGR02600 family)